MKLFFGLIFSFIALYCATSTTHAAESSLETRDSINFTSCLTPSGQVIANYDEGVHGIAGQGSKEGKDTVYLLENGNAMQCFCGSDGAGVQTNWLKSTGYSQDEVKVLESQGWLYIPSGSAWGLSDEPYLAKNLNYSCNSTPGSSTGDGKSDGQSDGKSDGHSVVQAATGISLASTGNLLFIIEIFTAGVLLTLCGIYLRLTSK